MSEEHLEATTTIRQAEVGTEGDLYVCPARKELKKYHGL
jgi:hypothetical protein